MKILNVELNNNDVNIIMESLLDNPDPDISDSSLADLFMSLSKCDSNTVITITEDEKMNVEGDIEIYSDMVQNMVQRLQNFIENENEDEKEHVFWDDNPENWDKNTDIQDDAVVWDINEMISTTNTSSAIGEESEANSPECWNTNELTATNEEYWTV